MAPCSEQGESKNDQICQYKGDPHNQWVLVARKVGPNRQSGTKSENKSKLSNIGEQVGHVAAEWLYFPE